MINTHKFELSLSRTSFHGSKGVRAIEVGLKVFSFLVFCGRDMFFLFVFFFLFVCFFIILFIYFYVSSNSTKDLLF